MNKVNYIWSLLLIFISFAANGQNLEEEIGFKYVKAEYLMKTERMEEAIKELDEVIKASPLYKDALMLRASIRYKLGAFKGAKMDVLEAINLLGITPDAAALLGKTEYALGNADAALNSLSAAIAMEVQDERIYELRAFIYEGNNQLLKACADWETATRLGSTRAAIKLKKLCGKVITKQDDPIIIVDNKDAQKDEEQNKDENVPPVKNTDDEVGSAEEEKETSNPQTNEDEIGQEQNEPVEEEYNMMLPPEDNTENIIEIDEDLSLTIYGQGLGKRKILDRPSILILSDESGSVTVEICVNENGKVDFAEYVPGKSSLTKNSLVSLAIRKSKEFWFGKSAYEKQCGYMVFNIKGSE
jgi:tetratricopeptide (TPR) repeat protein